MPAADNPDELCDPMRIGKKELVNNGCPSNLGTVSSSPHSAIKINTKTINLSSKKKERIIQVRIQLPLSHSLAGFDFHDHRPAV